MSPRERDIAVHLIHCNQLLLSLPEARLTPSGAPQSLDAENKRNKMNNVSIQRRKRKDFLVSAAAAAANNATCRSFSKQEYFSSISCLSSFPKFHMFCLSLEFFIHLDADFLFRLSLLLPAACFNFRHLLVHSVHLPKSNDSGRLIHS